MSQSHPHSTADADGHCHDCGSLHGNHHTLKCKPVYFAALWDGSKRFELRKDDRGFEVGHRLNLREWTPAWYSGREVHAKVGYILHGPAFGLPTDLCILSLTGMAGHFAKPEPTP